MGPHRERQRRKETRVVSTCRDSEVITRPLTGAERRVIAEAIIEGVAEDMVIITKIISTVLEED